APAGRPGEAPARSAAEPGGDRARPRPGEGAPAAGTIGVEIVSWVTKFAGGDGTGRRLFDEPVTEGATVRSVLAGVSRRFPELQAALWHGDALGEHIEVLVNDAVLGIHHTLDSRVEPGDRITLLGQYMGG
ncbi:MAG: MoaD/ThiS family protein, partial [Candidatus Rokuibacteriota bacterium]